MKEYDRHSHVPDDENIDKVLIEFSDGRVFEVPAEVIADDRASYYSDKYDDTDYEEEKEFVLNNPFELQDWMANNMNWEDLEDDAELVSHNKSDPSEEFINAEVSFGVEE